MDQADRDRLVSLNKAKKKLITQKEAVEELGITERQVRRLLRKLKKHGDKAVVHALRGEPSNRKTDEQVQQRAVEILSRPDYRASGPRWRQNIWVSIISWKPAGRLCGSG